jgi:hypothetical protein
LSLWPPECIWSPPRPHASHCPLPCLVGEVGEIHLAQLGRDQLFAQLARHALDAREEVEVLA